MHSKIRVYINLASLSLLSGVTLLLLALMNEESTFHTQNMHVSAHKRIGSDSFGYKEHNADKPVAIGQDQAYIQRPVRTRTLYPISKIAYKINNPNMCNTVTKVSCLIIVHTAPDHFAHRLGIRRTWGNASNYSPQNLRIAFLLGTVANSTLQKQLEKESKTFNDLIQGNFVDAYRNLTHKGVMGYKWITQHCQNAEVILKTDDDAVINLFKFFEECYLQYKTYEKTFWCNRYFGYSMPIVRQKISKWFVRPDEFKTYNFYPTKYCSGFALFMTPDLVRGLYQAALGTPFFWVDDFFLYGWLPARIRNVTYRNFEGNLTYIYPTAFKCYKEKKSNCEYLVFPSKPDQIDEMWNVIVSDRIQSKFGYYYAKLPNT